MTFSSRHFTRWPSLLVAALVSLSFSGCTLDLQGKGEYVTTSVIAYGPVRGFIEDDDSVRIDDRFDLRPVHVGGNVAEPDKKTSEVPGIEVSVPHRGRYHAEFQVVDAGPIFVRVIDEYSAGQGIWAEAGMRSRVLFFAAAPPGATLSLTFETEQDPSELRLRVDRENDDVVDEELMPVGWVRVDDSSSGTPVSQADIEELADGRARVTLQGTISNQAASDVGLFYMLYPQHAVAQTYGGPFIVDRPSYLLYGAFNEHGSLGKLHGVDLLGGLGSDLEMSVPTDGTPLSIEFTQPGQRAMLRYPTSAGDQLEFLVEDALIDALGDAGVSRASDHDVLYFERREPTTYELKLDLHWGYTGTVVVRMTNLNEHALPVEIGGPPVRDEFPLPGQRGEFNFDGVEHANLELVVMDVEGESLRNNDFFELNVYTPSGDVLLGHGTVRADGASFMIRLPETGRYRIEVNPPGLASGSASVKLNATPG